ncbi:ABC transporter permease [Butyrivibrio fibrisolvens]|uniref:ABC transporter permease n=1 Tax=Butyrivibrio fibrisolvens TaxID=831 RepID=UPI0003F66810|nr:ABC transporter permease [Butyrivibrio fibrisolvens]
MSNIKKDIGFVFDFAKDDIKTRYAGSRLGFLWAFIQPAVTIIMYWFVFQVGFGSKPVNGAPYIIWLASGLTAWFMVSDGISSSVSSLLEYKYLVKHVVFNIRIIPVIKVISVMFVQIFLILFMIVLCALMGYHPSLMTFQLLYYLLYAFVFVTAIAYFLSAAYVFFKDIAQLVGVALQLVFWFTPIVWNIEGMPLIVKIVSRFNPFFYIVRGYRDSFINQLPFWEYGFMNLFFWMIAIGFLIFSIAFFEKCMDHFADVI